MANSAASIVQVERRRLQRSSLTALAVAAPSLVIGAWFAATRWQFGASYPAKSVLLFGIGALLMLRALPSQHPFTTLGTANAVTLGRGVLVCLLAGLIGEHATAAPQLATSVALLIILLDGLDGWLARRNGTASAFGARFDMETDAMLVAVLAVLAWQFGKVGAWVLLSGAMRYLFLVAAVLIPLLRRPVPSSYRGKSIAIFQMLALVVAIAPVCRPGPASMLAALALILLFISFLLDVVWLLQQKSRQDCIP